MNKLYFGLSQNLKYISLVNRSNLFSPNNISKYSFSVQVDNKEHFDKLVKKNKVVIFMKGNPEEPRCGFSNAVVQIMRMHGVQYDSYDVLQDEQIRQGIKEYSDWPTIPQVFLNGEFVGGCDILIQMHQNGEFVEELQKIGITSALLQEVTKNDSGDKNK